MGVNENSSDNLVSIFPNPSNGKFTLQFKSLDIKKQKTILELYNLLGEKIYSQLIDSVDQLIDFSSQAKGVYFVKLKTDKSVCTKRIIIN